MNRIIVFLSLIVLFTGANAQPSIERTNEIAAADAARASRWQQIPLKYIGQNYDLKYINLDFQVDPDTNFIEGAITSYFVTTSSSVSVIDFELKSNMTVLSVLYHGSPVAYTHASDVVSITLPSPLASGTLDSIYVQYEGAPDGTSGFGSFIVTTHGSSTPIMWTLSEPYGAYEWWPCKNALNDKIDSIDVWISSPEAYHAASNGLLISEENQMGHNKSHWRHRYPIATYLIAIAVTDYARYTQYANLSAGSLPVLNYVFPEDSATAVVQTLGVLPVLELYDSLIGEYPFMNEKYGHAQFGWGGGMEHQTMSFMVNFDHGLMAHELSHMWFGDAITCASWHDIWINEGFATYMTGLTYERMFGGYWWNDWKYMTHDAVTSQPDGSVYIYGADTSSVDRVFDGRLSYNKGAYVLHMLRWVMGDVDFFAGLQAYFSDPNMKYKYASTEDFINQMETTSGLSLDEFFADWIYGEGYPSYTLDVEYVAGDSIRATLSQTTSDPSVSFFEMPVQVYFWENGVADIRVFDNTVNNQVFTFYAGYYPDSVVIDPNLWILTRDNNVTVSLSEAQKQEWQVYPNPAQNELVLEFTMAKANAMIVFYDAEGKEIMNMPCVEKTNVINISSFTPGTYTFIIRGFDENMTGTIIKNK